jgi:hypothetical protein
MTTLRYTFITRLSRKISIHEHKSVKSKFKSFSQHRKKLLSTVDIYSFNGICEYIQLNRFIFCKTIM